MEFMSTHPAHETRISDLQSWMPEALALYLINARQSSRWPIYRPYLLLQLKNRKRRCLQQVSRSVKNFFLIKP